VRCELAKRSKTALSTVQDFEAGLRDTQASNRAAIQAALERRGILFLDSGTLGRLCKAVAGETKLARRLPTGLSGRGLT